MFPFRCRTRLGSHFTSFLVQTKEGGRTANQFGEGEQHRDRLGRLEFLTRTEGKHDVVANK